MTLSSTSDTEVQTRSASGATKRARSVSRSRAPPKTRAIAVSSGDESGDVDDPIVGVSGGEESPRPQRGRGRPPTTGKGFLAVKRVEAKRELAALKAQAREVERLLGGGYDPVEYKAGSRGRREALMEEIPCVPSRDLVSRMHEGAQRIDGIACKSKNIKGVLVRELRDTAAFFAVAADALFNRGANAGGSSAAPAASSTPVLEANVLRLENETLREELARLRRAEEDRARMPPPSPLVVAEPVEAMEVADTPPVTRSATQPAAPPPSPSPKRGGKKKGRKGEARPPPDSPARPSPDAPQSSGEPLPLGREEVRRMVKEAVGSALQDLERSIGEQIRRALGGLVPQTNSGDGARNNAPRTTAPPSSSGKKGKAVQGGRPVPEAGAAPKGGKRGGQGKGGKQAPPPKPPRAPPGKGPPPAQRQQVEGRAAQDQPGPLWSKVLGRREKTAAQKAAAAAVAAAQRQASRATPKPPTKGQGKPGKATRRAPKTSAIVVTCPKGDYTRTMAEVVGKVRLPEAGLKEGSLKMRAGATGALIIEVPGQDHAAKADKLAGLMRAALGDGGARVDRPTKMADLRIRGPLRVAAGSVGTVVAAVAAKARCSVDVIQAGDIRQGPRGQGSLWLRLPLVSARLAAAGGKLPLAWTAVDVEVLDVRPLRCHRCLLRGHVRGSCPSSADRTDRCYRCGKPGHLSRGCQAPPKCPLCTDLGRPADHCLGAPKCAKDRREGGGRQQKGNNSPPVVAPAKPLPVVGGGGASGKRRGGQTITPPAAPTSIQVLLAGSEPMEVEGDGGRVALPNLLPLVILERVDCAAAAPPPSGSKVDKPPDTGGPF